MADYRVFKRKIYSKLLEWKQEENGRTALLVKGARRVGKSTIVEEFARNEYKSYLLVDFAKASAEVMFVGDTGLFVTLAFWDKDVTENVIYEKLLSDKLAANLGYVYENIVAQMLTASGNKLFYHTWPTESGKHNYEVDFLLSKGSKLWPIEVKSSGYKTHASLDAFCKKFSERVGERFLIYTKDFSRDGSTTLLPVVMTLYL